jgi:hypothetical protein
VHREPVRALESIECWLSPPTLTNACYYGRIDIVEKAIAAHQPLDGGSPDDNPIAAAIGAFVTTPLHVQCVERLFAAGAQAHLSQFWASLAESAGRADDVALRELLIIYGLRSSDAAVRAKAEEWSGYPSGSSSA